MQRRAFLTLGGTSLLGLSLALPTQAEEGLAVVANGSLRPLDAEQIKRIYTGRTVEIDGQALQPVQLAAGQPLRKRFHSAVLQQSEEDYVAYWTVRRYIGKGAPPRELASSAEVLAFVLRTPGAIGYVEPAELKPGLNVVFRR